MNTLHLRNDVRLSNFQIEIAYVTTFWRQKLFVFVDKQLAVVAQCHLVFVFGAKNAERCCC